MSLYAISVPDVCNAGRACVVGLLQLSSLAFRCSDSGLVSYQFRDATGAVLIERASLPWDLSCFACVLPRTGTLL